MSSRSTLCELHKSKLQAIILFIFTLILWLQRTKRTLLAISNTQWNLILHFFILINAIITDWSGKNSWKQKVAFRFLRVLRFNWWAQCEEKSLLKVPLEKEEIVYKKSGNQLWLRWSRESSRMSWKSGGWKVSFFFWAQGARESLMTHATFQPFSWFSRRDTK